jgi:hypothetical protein
MSEPTVTCLRCVQEGRELTAKMTHDEFIANLMQIPGAIPENCEVAWKAAVGTGKTAHCGNDPATVRSRSRPT